MGHATGVACKAGAKSSGNTIKGMSKCKAGAKSSGNTIKGMSKRKAGAKSIGNTMKGMSKYKSGKRSGVRRGANVALVVRQPWANYILDGAKTWEIRGSKTTRRGWIHLAQSGTGKLVGGARLVDCIRVPHSEFMKHRDLHCVPALSVVKYKAIYAWVFRGARRYKEPFEYSHTAGASIWVRV